jgi:hypothetical protein
MVLRIPFQVASLAKGSATLWIGVALVMIHVRDGQHHLAACLWMGLSIRRAALWMLWRAFTAIACTLQQHGTEGFPLFRMSSAARIKFHALWVYRHGLAS